MVREDVRTRLSRLVEAKHFERVRSTDSTWLHGESVDGPTDNFFVF